VAALLFVVVLVLMYLSAAIYAFLIYGPEHIPKLSFNLINYLYSIEKNIGIVLRPYNEGLAWVWKYKASLIQEPRYWAHNNYTPVKILFSIALPYIIIAIILYHYRRKILKWRPYKKKESVHGDARWAEEKDIVKAGLRAKTGMLLGRDEGGYYIASGYQHALLFAPTGSGKGVGFVIPNLLFWEESVIVHDIKLENHELTSGWREKKLRQKVYVWSPAEPDGVTHCYNPIDWVSSKPGQMVDDVQKLTHGRKGILE
jgi:type IV secretion system protein VirD4